MFQKSYYLILYVFCLRFVIIQADDYPYLLAKTEVAIHEELPTTLPLPKETFYLLEQILPPPITLLEKEALQELITLYATQLTSLPAFSREIDRLVESQFRHYHKEGLTKSNLQEKWNKKNMEEVRKAVKARCKKEIQCRYFIQQSFLSEKATPEELEHFYQIHFSSPPQTLPATYLILELICYPSSKEGSQMLSSLMTKLQGLHTLLSKLSKEKRRCQLRKSVRNYEKHSQQNFITQYNYLSSSRGTPYLTHQELPKEIQTILERATKREATLTLPHIFQNKQGKKGVRILFVQRYIPSHSLNLKEDYPLLQEIYLHTKSRDKLMNWWEIRQKNKEIIYFDRKK